MERLAARRSSRSRARSRVRAPRLRHALSDRGRPPRGRAAPLIWRSATSRWTQSGWTWPPRCPRRWWRSTTAHRMGFSRRCPDHGCTGRTARANARICDRAFACSCLLELNVSVVADQLTLSSSRARARMFCYGIFTHPLSSAYERPAYRISLCVLACVGCGTRGRLLGLSGRICHKVDALGIGIGKPMGMGSGRTAISDSVRIKTPSEG